MKAKGTSTSGPWSEGPGNARLWSSYPDPNCWGRVGKRKSLHNKFLTIKNSNEKYSIILIWGKCEMQRATYLQLHNKDTLVYSFYLVKPGKIALLETDHLGGPAFSFSPVLCMDFSPSLSLTHLDCGYLASFHQLPLWHLERLCCQSFICGFVCLIDFITPCMKCICANVWLELGIFIFKHFVYDYEIGGLASPGNIWHQARCGYLGGVERVSRITLAPVR